MHVCMFQTSAADRPSASIVVVVVVVADRTMADSIELKFIVSSPAARRYFTTNTMSPLWKYPLYGMIRYDRRV